MTEIVREMARCLDEAFGHGEEVAKIMLEEIAERYGRDAAVAALRCKAHFARCFYHRP